MDLKPEKKKKRTAWDVLNELHGLFPEEGYPATHALIHELEEKLRSM